jgi:hypothetical protein
VEPLSAAGHTVLVPHYDRSIKILTFYNPVLFLPTPFFQGNDSSAILFNKAIASNYRVIPFFDPNFKLALTPVRDLCNRLLGKSATKVYLYFIFHRSPAQDMAGIVGQVERLGHWILDYARQHGHRIWLAGHSAGISKY